MLPPKYWISILLTLWITEVSDGNPQDRASKSKTKCVITSPFDSPFVKAHLMNYTMGKGCTTNMTSNKGQEVHVINVKVKEKRIQVNLRVEPMSILDPDIIDKFQRPLVFVLYSELAVKWKVELVGLTSTTRKHLFVFIQKKVPNYGDVKEDTAWSMDKFNDYINENVAPEKGVEQDWVYNTLTKQMQRIMLHCFNSVKHKLQCKVGYFDLYGLDFMVDQEMKIWLIEINTNPCLAINCAALKEVIPGMVEETLHLCLESFEKSRRNQPLTSLSSLKEFTVLHCGSNPYAHAHRQTRSVSPAKENSQDKSRSTQSSNNPRQSRSPSRSVPRVAITQTPVVTQSQYQIRKSEFSSILNPQAAGGGSKTTTSAKVSTASGNSGSSNSTTTLPKSANGAGNTNSGNSGTASNTITTTSSSTDKTTKTANNTTASNGVKGNTGIDKSNNTPASTKSATAGNGTGVSGNSGTANSTSVKTPRTIKSADVKTSSKSEVTVSRKNNSNSSSSSSTASSSTKAGIPNGGSTSGTDKTVKTNNSARTTDVKTSPKSDSTAAKPRQGSSEKPANKNTNTSSQKPKTSSPSKTEADKGSKTDKSSKTTVTASSPKSDSSGKDVKTVTKTTKTESKKDSKVSEGLSVKQMVPSSQTPTSKGSGDEDVKLKMTHAKASANRKNRPRADTGN